MPPRLSSTPAYTSNVELYGEDSAGLTPRTPYSRQAANAEEGRSRRVGPVIPVNAPIAEDEDDGILDEIDLFQTQNHPLLASSDSASFPSANRRSGTSRWTLQAWKKDRLWRWLEEWAMNDRFPLGLIAGTAVAVFLLFLLAISIKGPDALLDYMGVNSTAIKFEALDEESKARFNDSTVIDYSKSGYTSFPLTTAQYISECWTITNDPRMKFSTPYWTARPGVELDVLHKVLSWL